MFFVCKEIVHISLFTTQNIIRYSALYVKGKKAANAMHIERNAKKFAWKREADGNDS
jgi:hypothetical protein